MVVDSISASRTDPSEELQRSTYRADIDGIRAIAVLSVVGFHAFPLPFKGGFVGVDIFFVISGFLISTLILENLRRDSFSFADFYARRIKRIFPSLLVVLAACFVFGWFALLSDEYKQLGKHIAGGAGFIANFLFWGESGYFDKTADVKPLLHLWSLGVEEQFYIVWPLLVWIAIHRRLNLKAITVAIVASSFCFCIFELYFVHDLAGAFYSPLTRIWELLAGSLLAYATLSGSQPFETWQRCIINGRFGSDSHRARPLTDDRTLRNRQSVLGAALIVFGVFVITRNKLMPGWWALLPTIGTVLLISAGEQACVNRLLKNRWLVWFGLISYPLYLWHWPLLSFARILEGQTPNLEIRAAAVVISIALAWLTYELIEKPIRFGQHGRRKAVALTVLMVVVGSIGYLTDIDNGFGFRAVAQKNDVDENIVTASNPSVPCPSLAGYPMVAKFCKAYAPPNPAHTIVLWGDSYVGAWLQVFLDIAKQNNDSVITIMQPSCPPLLEARKTHFDDPELATYCGDGKMQGKVVAYIRELKPDLIFMLAAWDSYSPVPNRDLITDQDSGQANRATTQATMARRVPETLVALGEISRTIVFKSWPFLRAPPNYEMLRSRIPFLQTKETDYADGVQFKNDSAYLNRVFAEIDNSNVVFFDPAQKICSETRCETVINGTRMYHDHAHISARGSMLYRPNLENLIKANLAVKP